MKLIPLFGLCLIFGCASSAWAGIDTGTAGSFVGEVPAASSDSVGATPADPAKKCEVPVCYNRPHGCAVVGAKCNAYDAANPGYFSGVDAKCGLTPGTAIAFANIESSCSANVANKFGYTGLFQFNTKSCPGGDLTDPGVQAACMCNYTANSMREYSAVTGENPSSAVLYLMHQQGPCGLRLALPGNAGQSAVSVLARCFSTNYPTKAGAMAMSHIFNNLPASMRGMASSITAAQFANLYTSKFKGVDATAACVAGGPSPTTVMAGGTPAATVPDTGILTQSGNPLLASVVQALMTQNLFTMFPSIPTPDYDTLDNGGQTGSQTDSVNIATNNDGTKTVTVTKNGAASTYTVAVGQQLWLCGGIYETVAAGSDDAMTRRSCTKVTEAVAPAQ